MSKVILWGTVLGVKAYDGKTTKFATARVKEEKGTHSFVAFGEQAEALTKLENKYAIVTGYLKNQKKDDGTFERQVVCQSVEPLMSDRKPETNANEDIPF